MSHSSDSQKIPPFLKDLLERLKDSPLFSVLLTFLLFCFVATIYALGSSLDKPMEDNPPLIMESVARSDFERYQHSYQNISREIFEIARLRTKYNLINYE